MTSLSESSAIDALNTSPENDSADEHSNDAPTSGNAPTLADWKLAARIGRMVSRIRTVPTKPEEAKEIRALVNAAVADVDEASRVATGLGTDLPPATARVVSRGKWIDGNLESIRFLTDPHAERLIGRSAVPESVSRKAVGMQFGIVFGYLSTKVLGQYEVFLPNDQPGRLTLVGPNILALKRDVDKNSDGLTGNEVIRGIVLHELAHRLQFEGVPWLRPYLLEIIESYIDETDLDSERVRDGVWSLWDKVTAGNLEFQDLFETLLSGDQAEQLKRAQATMSLLEGHGNIVMDWGAEAVAKAGLDPSRVRTALNKRRGKDGAVGNVVGKALGLEMKAQQYAVGEQWIIDVADAYGRDAFNRVWDTPENLPTPTELDDHTAWARRLGIPDLNA